MPDTLPFEIAARAVCRAEVVHLKPEAQDRHVAANWQARQPEVTAAHVAWVARQGRR